MTSVRKILLFGALSLMAVFASGDDDTSAGAEKRHELADGQTLTVSKGTAVIKDRDGKTVAVNRNLIRTADEHENCPSRGLIGIITNENSFAIHQQNCSGWFFIDETLKCQPTSKRGYELSKVVLRYSDRRSPESGDVVKVLTSDDFGSIKFEEIRLDDLYKLVRQLKGLPPCAGNNTAPSTTSAMSAESYYSQLRTNTSSAYREAETHLLEHPDAPRVLRALPADADVVERLQANCLVDWAEGRAPHYSALLDYFKTEEQRTAHIPFAVPLPEGVASQLGLLYQDKVADFLSVRLCKETDWPDWQIRGVLLYLQAQKRLSTTQPLVRFASETSDGQLRQMAKAAINAINDLALPEKLKSERLRAEAMKKPFPRDLSELKVQ